ncbi:MAG: SurA N-terminal domain-containing protein [Pirellulales bacterium]|nr:SurA N-terminal domain-containing protein [Pirellulales bacterium]
MTQKTFLIFSFLLAASFSAGAQQFSEKKPAGIVGGRIISTDEFIQRYELNPKPGMKPKDKNLDVRLEFLQSLIAEKLWAREAESLGLDSTEAMLIAAEELLTGG